MTTPLISNLASFKRTIEYEKARVKGQATKRYQKFVTAILTDLAKNTPQWSGDLAASWEVVIGAGGEASPHYDTPFKQRPHQRPAPFFRGDMPAVKYTLMVNKFAIDTLKWNNKVSVVNNNPTLHQIQKHAPTGDGWLRPRNFISGDILATAFVAHKWGTTRGYGDLNLNPPTS